MNNRNRVEVLTLADSTRLVRLNGNNIHKVRQVHPNLEDNTVTLVIDADFSSQTDDGTVSALVEEERVAEVMANRQALINAYNDGSIIHVRPFNSMEAWQDIHRVSNPHEFDFDVWEYAFPKGVKK